MEATVKLKEQLATIQVGEFLSIITEFGSHCQKLPSCWHIIFGTETELHTSCISVGFDSLMQVQVQSVSNLGSIFLSSTFQGSNCHLLSKNL
jgi:hypothetical protein